MKKSIVDKVKQSFQNDIYEIESELRRNAREINKFSEKNELLKRKRAKIHGIMKELEE